MIRIVNNVTTGISIIATSFAIICFAGCLPKDRELEQGGPYTSLVEYQADLIVSDAVDVMERLIRIKERNPLYFARSESARKLLEEVEAELDGVPKDDELLVKYYTAKDLWEASGMKDTGVVDFRTAILGVRNLAREILIMLANSAETNNPPIEGN